MTKKEDQRNVQRSCKEFRKRRDGVQERKDGQVRTLEGELEKIKEE